MESGFEDDFAPMQSSNGAPAPTAPPVSAPIDDAPFILGEDVEESPKKTSEGEKFFYYLYTFEFEKNLIKFAKRFWDFISVTVV